MINIKKIFAGIVGLCTFCTTIPSTYMAVDNTVIAAADEYETTESLSEVETELNYHVYDNYVEITECNKDATTVTIPAEIGGLPVTSIGGWAFSGCTSLTSITIPDSVTSIGYDAFGGCTSLTSITIPDSVTSISSSAFSGCTSLTSITIPDSVTEIGGSAFSGCTSLTSITIPDSVTSIGYYAFSGCTNLTAIDVSKDNLNYSSQNGILFNKDKTELIRCPESNGITSYDIPDTVTSIDEYAFRGCTSLTSITIPDSVTEIDGSAFWGCTSLTSITIPDSVMSVEESSFWGCTSLTAIYVSKNNLKYSSQNGILFNKDKTELIRCPESNGITSYDIPDTVTSIGTSAFWGCTSLECINIPDSVTYIGRAFCDKCPSLTEINVDENNETYSSLDGVLYRKSESGIYNKLLIYPMGKQGEYTVFEETKSIADYAFEGCTGVTAINIPASVTYIGRAFCDKCPSLTEINVDENNETYSSLDGVLYRKSESGIYNSLLIYPMGKQGEYTVFEETKIIADYAFEGCINLTSITIPDSVTEIGDRAFSGCTSLESITIENSDCKIYGGSSTISNGYDDEEWKHYFNGTIYGYSNSTAQRYAESYNYNFVDLNSVGGTTTTPNSSKPVTTTTTVEKPIDTTTSETTAITTSIPIISQQTTTTLPDKIQIQQPYVGNLYVGNTFNLNYITNNYSGSIIWASGTPDIVNINTKGEVTVIGEGNALIYAIDNEGKSYKIQFNTFTIKTTPATTTAKKPITTTTTKKPIAATSLPSTTIPITTTTEAAPKVAFGDVDNNGSIDALDASIILTEYALIATNHDSLFNNDQKKAADLNKDGSVDALDASLVLSYYAYRATGGHGSLNEFLNK